MSSPVRVGCQRCDSSSSKMLSMQSNSYWFVQFGNCVGSTSLDFPPRDESTDGSERFSLERISDGFAALGTHSIHMRQPSCRHIMCQAVVRCCTSLDRHVPFVRAPQTDWLSMKKIMSLPLNFSPNVKMSPAAAMSSSGMIWVLLVLRLLNTIMGVSIAHAEYCPSIHMHPPNPLRGMRGGWRGGVHSASEYAMTGLTCTTPKL